MQALTEKNNPSVSVPAEFTGLQLNQGEKHLKYPSAFSSVLSSVSHQFLFGKEGIVACSALVAIQFILYSPEAKQSGDCTPSSNDKLAGQHQWEENRITIV